MGIQRKLRNIRKQAGTTLIEVMVSTGLVGVILIVIMSLLGEVGTFVSLFNSQASTIEGVASAVGALNSSLPMVTRITACNCVTASGTRDTCRWEPGANAWWDPVINGSQASPVTLLAGEFEAHPGPTTALTDVLSSNIGVSFQGQACAAHASDLGTALSRGCKQTFTLAYRAPTPATTSPSLAGMVTLSTTASGGSQKVVMIGQNDVDGLGGVGVSELSCGFDKTAGATSATGISGAVFVLNMRIKAKSNTIQNTANPKYESWYPGRSAGAQTVLATKNYLRGQFREIRLKFAMRNISVRGLYSWRAESVRNCKTNGQAASNAAQCCSQAITGANCAACVPGGTSAGTAARCCSGAFVTGSICR